MLKRREQDSRADDRGEQGNNPVQSGITDTQTADLFEEALSAWRGSSKVSFDLLRCLCRLARQHPDSAYNGFTALEIRDELMRLRRGWMVGSDAEAVARRVRKEFQTLKEELSGKHEHLAELAHQRGVPGLPDVDRTEGGGSGNVTRYFLYLRDAALAPSVDVAERELSSEPGTVHYVCEDSRERAGLRQLLDPFSGQRSGRYLFVGIGLAALLLGLVLLLLWILIFQFGKGDLQTLKALLMIGCLAALLYWATRPVFLVLSARVVAAPMWLQSDDSDNLIEWRSPPRWAAKSVHLVRYSGECPLCRGRVLVQQRRWFAPDDLVGRCEEAPRAHVFTFDHVLRTGRYVEVR